MGNSSQYVVFRSSGCGWDVRLVTSSYQGVQVLARPRTEPCTLTIGQVKQRRLLLQTRKDSKQTVLTLLVPFLP